MNDQYLNHAFAIAGAILRARKNEEYKLVALGIRKKGEKGFKIISAVKQHENEKINEERR